MKKTGSKLPLYKECPAAAALPWIDEPPGESAIRGTVIHAFLEACATDGRDVALERAPEEARPFLKAIDLESLTIDLVPEATFALDWRQRKARFVGSGLNRQYPPPESPTEIFLTTDIFGVSATSVLVEDYKTGRTRYGDPDKFWQVLAGALAACWTYKRDAATVGLIYIDDDGEVFRTHAPLDSWDLESFADDLERTMTEVERAEAEVAAGRSPDVKPGDHCVDLYCPAFRACPSTSALVRHMPEHLGEIQRPGYLAPERLSKTWHDVMKAKAVLDAIEQEIRRLSFREPIELGDGYWLAPRERRVETFDGAVSRDVVNALVGPGYGDKAVTLETSKSAIEEAAKAYRNNLPGGKGPDGKRVVLEKSDGTGLLDRVHAEIRNRGGAKISITNNPIVHKRKALPSE